MGTTLNRTQENDMLWLQVWCPKCGADVKELCRVKTCPERVKAYMDWQDAIRAFIEGGT